MDAQNEYKSPFPVEGYNLSENLWRYISHFREKTDFMSKANAKNK
jgi:hypothetical protein